MWYFMRLSIGQSDLSTVDTWHVEVALFFIFFRTDAIQGNPDYGTFATEPVSLNSQSNIIAFQWHVIG